MIYESVIMSHLKTEIYLIKFNTFWYIRKQKKSRIWETRHLSTDVDSSTGVIGGWTKNTSKPDFFEKRKKISKTQNLKNI